MSALDVSSRLVFAFFAGAIAFGTMCTPAAAQTVDPEGPVSAAQLLESIEKAGGIYFAEAEADVAAAEARLKGAQSALLPNVSAQYEAERFDPSADTETRRGEVIGSLEVVQRLYDFGQTSNLIDAAKADANAARVLKAHARNTVLMEGLALFYELHASELRASSLDQSHASAYVRWERAEERHGLGQTSPIEVAERLAFVEATRLTLRREQQRNLELRLRLADLSGLPFSGPVLNPPLGPKERPSAIDIGAFEKAVHARNPRLKAMKQRAESLRLKRDGTFNGPVLEAYGSANHYSRSSGTRDDWAAGARIRWPLYDGGSKSASRAELNAEQTRADVRAELTRRELTRHAQTILRERDVAWQQLLAARAQHDYTEKNLLQRQRLYEQERVADLGRAMINFTTAEADVVRAAGTLALINVRIAAMLGEHPARGLNAGFLLKLLGESAEEERDSYQPAGGSGYGQNEQK